MVDASVCLADAIYRLGFASLADSESAQAYTTNAELFQFADDHVKHLSYQGGIFIGLDSSVAVTAGVGVYALPSSHVFTLMAWIAPQAGVGGSNQPLRPTSVGNLFALDTNWATTAGESNRFSLDAGSVGTITTYPISLTSGTLCQICQQFPSTVTAVAPQVLEMPSVLQDTLTYAMLAGARGKESDSAMPEMAAHFKQRLDLYDQVVQHLWGPGQ
jgi:hypothetical protein